MEEVSICRSGMRQYLRIKVLVFRPRQQPIAILLVEAYCPGRGAPGADEDRLSGVNVSNIAGALACLCGRSLVRT